MIERRQGIAMRRPVIRSACVLVLALGLVCPPDAPAASLRAIRAEAETLSVPADQGVDDRGHAESATQRLGKLVLAYIEESDRLQQSERVSENRAELRSTFDAVHAPLDRLYTAGEARLEAMSRAVMERDGDLEALYRSESFVEAQTASANALYYLNWLNYFGARVFEEPRRTELLRRAEAGFSQFLGSDQAPELAAESLLGRGLCYTALGKLDWARVDLERASEIALAPQQRSKARVALLEAVILSGDTVETIRMSGELLEVVPPLSAKDLAVVRYLRLQALLDAAADGGGEEAKRYRREAQGLADQLRRGGESWSGKVDALLELDQVDPEDWRPESETGASRWQRARLFLRRRDCGGARPLLEALVSDGSESVSPFRKEARYWLGVCLYEAGDWGAATVELDLSLEQEFEPAFAADARYYRFKALEAWVASDSSASPELGTKYVDALRDFASRHADDPRIDEVRYRLGEYLQTTGAFRDSIAIYDTATSDPLFSLRASFGTLQSRFELLRRETAPAGRKALEDVASRDFERFDRCLDTYRNAPDFDPAVAEELAAKATLLRAVHVSLGPVGGDARAVEILERFAADYPGQSELASQAVRMRLNALLELGRFEDAEREVARSVALLEAEGRVDALLELASSYARAGRMRGPTEGERSAARVALALYRIAKRTGTWEPGRRDRVAIAQLEEEVGDRERAAAEYRAVLAERADDVAALRGSARVAEAGGDTQEALRMWERYTGVVRPGEAAWFRGHYEQARLDLESGNAEGCCRRLRALRTALPALRDETIHGLLQELRSRAGC